MRAAKACNCTGEYTPYEKQGQLVHWAKFAVQYKPYLKFQTDGKTIEVVLVRKSIHVATIQGCTSATW